MKTRCLNCMKEYSDEYDICPHCGFVRGTPPKESYHLHPGVILHERYIVGTVVSFGGFGVVYRAWDSPSSEPIWQESFYRRLQPMMQMMFDRRYRI